MHGVANRDISNLDGTKTPSLNGNTAPSCARMMPEHRIYKTPFASVYPHCVRKAEAKGRTMAGSEPRVLVCGQLVGIESINMCETGRPLTRGGSDISPRWNLGAHLITGTVCGIRVENIEDPLMQKLRYLDKLVDELATGKKMEKILRKEEPTP